ncbi:MAG: hypothetical protein DRO18_01615 [Thermoprotei archaeon]|nr:MAG: hypothetical protein DRO18_01615 [Thermoprotei archaeon]
MDREILIVGRSNGKLIVRGLTNQLKRLGLGTYSEAFNSYVLDVSELAYLIYKGMARVRDDEGPLDLRKLFMKYSRGRSDWIKFTVLLDLRERGRKARAGFSPNALIYEKGSTKIMVFVTEENAPLEARNIIEWIEIATRKGYEPVLAVVDAHGDVTYYSIFKLRPEDLEVRT